MGLRDIIQGMKNGPRGQRQPHSSGSGGGMSRIMMALLGLLAYKAFKGSGGQAGPNDPGSSPPTPAGHRAAGSRDRSQTAVGGHRRNQQRAWRPSIGVAHALDKSRLIGLLDVAF